MEILKYSAEHDSFRETLRKFLGKEVVPFADQWEQEGIVPREAWKKAGEQGFLCTSVPEKYGGAGADFLYSIIVIEEMIHTRQFGLLTPLHSDIIVPYITSYASEELKQKYLPGCISGDIITAVGMTEPGAGSDLTSISTTATRAGDEVIINGQKTFISCGINCDLVIVAAKDPDIDDPYNALDLYLVDASTPGFKKGNKLDKMGWRSQDTAELFFSDCRIPVTNRLGQKGGGFLMLMDKLQPERLVCTVGALTAAEIMIDLTIDFCKNHNESGKPLSKYQATQHKIIDMLTEIKLGRTFTDKLIADHIEGIKVPIEVSMAKAWVTDMAKRVADGCMDLFGNYGYYEEYPIARFWRDIRVMSIFAGTNEIMKGIAAKFMGL